MGQITIDQSHSVMAILATNADWSQIDFEQAGLQEAIVRDPKGAGERFIAWLKNGGRMMVGEPKKVKLDHTKPFNPTKFIGDKGWTTWLGPADGDGLSGEPDQDLREMALDEVDFSQAALIKNFLKASESSITGEENLRRQKEAGDIRLGGATFLALWQDYQANRENSVLEWLYRTRKITYLDFFGLVLRSPFGYRCVLCLRRRGDGSWGWDCDWLGGDWDSERGSAGSRK